MVTQILQHISYCLRRWIAPLAGLFLIIAANFIAPPVNAQEPAEITDELIETADGGDAYSAYILADALFRKSGEKNIESAIYYFSIAFQGYQVLQSDDRIWAGYAALRIAEAYIYQAKYIDAVRFYQGGIEIIEEYMHIDSAQDSRWSAYMGTARALVSLERSEDALEVVRALRDEIASQKGEDHPMYSESFAVEALALDTGKLYDESLVANVQALNGYKKLYGEESIFASDVTNNIGATFYRQKNFALAEPWFERALPLIVKYHGSFSDAATVARINLSGTKLENGNYDDAIRWAMRAMPFVRANKTITLDHQRWLFDILSRSVYSKGDTEKAIAFGKLAVNAQQSIRELNSELGSEVTKGLQDEWRKLYENLAKILIEQGRIAEAQSVLNMEKEQEIFNFLRRDSSAEIGNTTAILTDAELTEQQKIEQLGEYPVETALALFQLTLKINDDTATDAELDQAFALQDALQQSNMLFDQEVDSFLKTIGPSETESLATQFAQLGTIQALLEKKPKRTAMLQVASIADKTHLFLTLPNLNIHKEVDIEKAVLAKLVFDTLQSIEQRSAGSNELLRELNDVLFEPVRDAVDKSDVEIVMLNLTGFLRYVPFAALYDGKEYLVQNFAFSLYTPAIETEFANAERERAKTAGFGVTAAHPGFSELPGVAEELETIFAGSDAQGVLEGPTALDQGFDKRSLRRALLKKPKILHIASHFNLVPGQEDDSFLLLGDGSHLKLSEIRKNGSPFGFKGVDLVTLSACQTALGSGDGSEIDGFGAVAQASGASAVMASLWPVADNATPLLMRDFYQSMIDGGKTKAEALQIAQIAMLSGSEAIEVAALFERGAAPRQKARAQSGVQSTFAHPYFWSPFVLMGNWL
ncbi:MAG: CHAT domain-containing protein [Hyphomicrobiales bacterium]